MKYSCTTFFLIQHSVQTELSAKPKDWQPLHLQPKPLHMNTLSTYPYNNRLTFYSCSGRAASEQALTNANSSVTIGRLHKSDEVVSATREHAEDVLLGAHVLER